MARFRTRRQIRFPARYAHADIISYVASVAIEYDKTKPLNYKEAISHKDKDKWIKVMVEEMDCLVKNKIWTLVDKSEH